MKKFLLSIISLYRHHISPAKLPCCRFTPSCSEYARLAIETHGAAKGSLKALWRILRCNPFNKNCGVDYSCLY